MTPDPLTPSPDSVFLNPEIARRIEELDKEYQAADPAVRHGLAVLHYEEVLKIAVQQGLSFVADIHSAIKCGEALGLADDDPRTLIEAAHDLRAENAALVKEREADHRQIEWLQNFADSAMATLAEENRSLRAQLAETQQRVEQLMGINKELHGIFLHNLALQAQVEKLRAALRSITKHQTQMGGSFDQWYKEINEIAFAALSSQPDLPLIEEVRKDIQDIKRNAETMGCGGSCIQIIATAEELLTRLNPRK